MMSLRTDYKGTWNGLATTKENAMLYVGGTVDEADLDATGIHTVNVLRATVGLRPTDDVVEIGCGVGRAGKAVSPIVKSWTGCDVSGQMVRFAKDRLAQFSNTNVVEISGYDLRPLADASFDVVYSTVVFMHIDEWDRYNYVREAYRVLRPGGRFWCDNTNLCTEDGWKMFEALSRNYKPSERPAHISKCSTPQELETYLKRAGFSGVQTRERGDIWVDAWGVKPS